MADHGACLRIRVGIQIRIDDLGVREHPVDVIVSRQPRSEIHKVRESLGPQLPRRLVRPRKISQLHPPEAVGWMGVLARCSYDGCPGTLTVLNEITL